jgi:hypothetical protein
LPSITQIDWKDRQAGDVGCARHKGPVSDLIVDGERLAGECAGGFEASHCIIVGNNKILESIYPKVSLSPWNTYDGVPTAIFRISGGALSTQTALLGTISEFVGRGYDLTGTILGMAALELARALRLPAENNLFADKQKVFCSELATDYIRRLIIDHSDPNATDPQQVYNFLAGKQMRFLPRVAS